MSRVDRRAFTKEELRMESYARALNKHLGKWRSALDADGKKVMHWEPTEGDRRWTGVKGYLRTLKRVSTPCQSLMC